MKIKAQIKEFLIWAGKAASVLFLAAIAGLLMLISVYRLGTGLIFSHVLESVLVLEKEGNSYDIGGIEAYITDSFDDAYFLNQAMMDDSHGLLETALSGYTYEIPGTDSPAETLTAYLRSDPDPSSLAVSAPLVRFWCGYLVPLKLALKFLSLSQLRLLNLYLQPLIMLALMMLMSKKGLGRYMIGFFISWLLLGPVSMELCLAYSGYFYCTFIPCILLLLFYERIREKGLWLFFLLTGISVIYFNINFFQLISFAFPFVILCLMDQQSPRWQDTSFSVSLRKLASCFANWFTGFAGMMVMKWVLYAVLINRSILTGMYRNILFRSGSADETGAAISRWDAVLKNIIFTLSMRSWLLIELIFVFICIIYRLKKGMNKHIDAKTLSASLFMTILTMILIIIRYAVFPNHVWTHEWVMYRLCAIPVLVFNSCLLYYPSDKTSEI